MKKHFFLCGLVGWCLEITWTGVHSLLNGEYSMMGKTSLLMFPIYGCASIIKPLYPKLLFLPLFFRGCIYTIGIYIVEYFCGIFFKSIQICPWDYSKSPFNYKGVIRFDYIPVWFITGLIFEKILKKSS